VNPNVVNSDGSYAVGVGHVPSTDANGEYDIKFCGLRKMLGSTLCATDEALMSPRALFIRASEPYIGRGGGEKKPR
jgi:hypothetical protein